MKYMCITFRFYFSRFLTHSLSNVSHTVVDKLTLSLSVCLCVMCSSLTVHSQTEAGRQADIHTNTYACAQWKTVCQQTSIDSGQKHPLEVCEPRKNEQFQFSFVVNILRALLINKMRFFQPFHQYFALDFAQIQYFPYD